jgi:hypothetical protein
MGISGRNIEITYNFLLMQYLLKVIAEQFFKQAIPAIVAGIACLKIIIVSTPLKIGYHYY